MQDLDGYPYERVPLTIVDVETTGTSPHGDRVCEVAVVFVEGGQERARFFSLVNPGRPISPEARRINGITDAEVRSAPRFVEVADQVVTLLRRGVFVAHNASFDLGFLDAELGRCGLSRPDGPVVDTLEIARRCFTFPRNSLPVIADSLGIAAGGHRALGDALTTWRVLDRFVSQLGGAAMLTLGELLALQSGRPAPPPPPPRRPTLAEAVQSGRRLRLVYLSAEGSRTVRLVKPLELSSRDGKTYLVAYCYQAHEKRMFRVDRIVDWEVG